jgi:hypothetical protein
MRLRVKFDLVDSWNDLRDFKNAFGLQDIEV